MTRFRRAATIAAATSVVLFGTAAAASAQTLSLRDAHHDVWKSTDGGKTFTAAPRQSAADVTKATLRYRGKNVVFTEHFVNLRQRDAGDVYTLGLRTNTGLRRLVLVEAVQSNWPGTVWMDRPTDLSKPVPCDGLTEHIGYPRDLVRVVVPASCLKNPRAVQFTEANIHIKSPTVWFADNPMNTQAKPHSWSAPVRKG
jgi:hypothetical protein